MKTKRTITIPSPDYQPKKAEMRAKIKIDVHGKDLEEQMSNAAKALMRPVKIKYQAK